jgi:hypothetical protein
MTAIFAALQYSKNGAKNETRIFFARIFFLELPKKWPGFTTGADDVTGKRDRVKL